jgi:hypothetical protein
VYEGSIYPGPQARPCHERFLQRVRTVVSSKSVLLCMQARPEVQVVQRGGTITVADVQALLLWVLADGTNPKWAFVRVSSRLHVYSLLAISSSRSSCVTGQPRLLSS